MLCDEENNNMQCEKREQNVCSSAEVCYYQ